VTVYVDDMRAPFGRLIMCHMIADTEAELHAMADRIGVARKWHQGDHYDIALSKRALAVEAGAVEIKPHEAAIMMSEVRRGLPLPSPADVPALIDALHERVRARMGRLP
jgi:hypothetical protein